MKVTHCLDIAIFVRTALKQGSLTIMHSAYETDGIKIWALHPDGQMYQVKIQPVDQLDEVIPNGR